MEEIRYLTSQERQMTRVMYEEIFPEDSKEFVDYYYEWKTRENEILVMEESNMLQVMIHLNPYFLWMNGRLREVPYIVAVATHPGCRRQGKMGRVMERALQDLAGQQVPFTFLMPADPAYYLGQGFVFFPCQDSQKSASLRAAEAEGFSVVKDAGRDESLQHFYTSEAENFFRELQWQKAKEADIPEMVEFSNNILEERYHIFVKRDARYYQRLFVETKTEQGGILLLRQKKRMAQQKPALGKAESRLKGILIYGVEQQKAEIQELLLETDDDRNPLLCAACKEALPGLEITFGEFPMMLRIANLREFVSLMKCEKNSCYDVRVRDEMIPDNCGCFRIELCTDGGRIQEIPKEKVKENVDIRRLAQMLLADTRVYLREWV